ncbi:MAG: hypothetical protein NC935_03675 [Candidatus Omnitrophica bacterium]|nr:hypothetical protein [Candidatus Omnitrophota bacterium]
MAKYIDAEERESEILNFIIKSYIEESKPISSNYLCERYNLPYSSATIRNIMESLEKKGFLSHIHTSSGRVPTKKAFKKYTENIKNEDFIKDYKVSLDFYSQQFLELENYINYILDALSNLSGYTSLVAFERQEAHLFFKGIRFILEQPEFEDIHRIRNLFYTLEVKISQLQEILFRYLDEKLTILVGDEIGFEEISDCSLLVSGIRAEDFAFALALLGPMRMNYYKAASCLYAIKNELKKIIENFYG